MMRFRRVLVVYDRDEAGQKAVRRFSGLRRARLLTAPEHDLSDYWRRGGDLGRWIEERVNEKD